MSNSKILMVGWSSPKEGGSERHIYEISSRIGDCDVLTQRGGSCNKKIELPIKRLDNSFLNNFYFSFLASFYLILSLFRFKKRWDIIHLHENLLYPLVLLLKIRYKVVVTVHGIEGFRFHDNKFLWFFFSFFLRCSNLVIAVNKKDETELIKINKKVTYIPNGVDNSVYSGLNVDVKKIIGFIGRIHEQKGIIYLLEAFSKLEKKYSKFKLEIIGKENDYSTELRKKFPSKNIIWRGYLSDRKEIARCLKKDYCIVLPSLWEGLPLTLFEALGSSRPVLVSDIGAFKSVINDEAMFFKVKDNEDLYKRLEEIIKNVKKANSLGVKGKKLAEKYDWKNIAKQTEEIYKL